MRPISNRPAGFQPDPTSIHPRDNRTVKACILPTPAPVESRPLRIADVPKPEPTGNQVLVKIHACGVCRTDLHVLEGELAPVKSPIIPGHQAVGVVEASGPNAKRFQPGARVGIPWLY